MKKVFFIGGLLAFSVFSSAQLPGILNRAKQRAENKVNEKVNKKTDDTVDSAFGKVEKTGKDKPDEKNNTTGPVTATTSGPVTANTSGPVTFKTYSKYDFVPGEKVIAFEDFSTGNIGDFPGSWNTNGSAE